MFLSQKYKNKTIAIYGMGLTGYSTTRTLKKLGINLFCWDDNKKVRKKIKNFNFPIYKFWLSKKPVDKILISPGIDINKCKISKYLKKNKNKIITDLDLFFEFNKESTIISVTGTNGKSTTCKIIEKILKTAKYKVKTVGNIGNPVFISNNIKKKNIFIIEISSYQLEYSKLFRSKHAAILNISTDHLERHKNMKNYTKIKSKIFFAQRNSDFSYINLKNKYSKSIKSILKSKKVKSKLVEVNKTCCSYLMKKVNNPYFKNESNIENLAFAYKIVKNFKISDKLIIKALNNFKGLPHRQEVVFSNKKLLFINDSKATSFDACYQSLLNYNTIYWIFGGLPKYKDYFYLEKVKNRIVKGYIIGKHISFFKKKIKNNISFSVSKNIKNALNSIYKDLRSCKKLKKTILLSPAAASFDQFDNFEERGEYFKKLAIKTFKKGTNV